MVRKPTRRGRASPRKFQAVFRAKTLPRISRGENI
jgi:hypothetical protein